MVTVTWKIKRRQTVHNDTKNIWRKYESNDQEYKIWHIGALGLALFIIYMLEIEILGALSGDFILIAKAQETQKYWRNVYMSIRG